jgi:hypothetical protein
MTIPQDLLNDLRGSPTDLARLVVAVVRDGVPYVKIPTQAMRSWERRAPVILRFEGRVTSVSPREVLIAAGQPVSRWFPTTPRWAPEVP